MKNMPTYFGKDMITESDFLINIYLSDVVFDESEVNR